MPSVEDRHVGTFAGDDADGFLPVGGGCRDRDAGLEIEQRGDGFAEKGLVIGEHDPDVLAH